MIASSGARSREPAAKEIPELAVSAKAIIKKMNRRRLSM
jgi:hypothetical protein